jgi:hypothetical protein
VAKRRSPLPAALEPNAELKERKALTKAEQKADPAFAASECGVRDHLTVDEGRGDGRAV